jgi:hypothetical protein
MVEDIECLYPEFKRHRLANREVFVNGHIEVSLPGIA